MKPLLIALPVLCAATLLAADNQGEKKKSDNDLIHGKWKVVSMQEPGSPAKESGIPFTHFEFTTDKMKVWGRPEGGGPVVVGFNLHYKLDASKKPKTMDTSHELDKGKPIVQLASYSLEGDELKFSWASAGRPYPTKVAPGDWVFVVLKREKKAEK